GSGQWVVGRKPPPRFARSPRRWRQDDPDCPLPTDMSYALQTLWHERVRYISGVAAVTFSAVLIALQCGLLLGLFKITSIPIDNTEAGKGNGADIWVGSKGTPSVDLGKPVPE